MGEDLSSERSHPINPVQCYNTPPEQAGIEKEAFTLRRTLLSLDGIIMKMCYKLIER